MSSAAVNAHPSLRTRLHQSAITQAIIALLCVGVPFVLSNIIVRWFPAGTETAPLRNAFKTVVLIAAYWAYVRWVEKRSPVELSVSGALKELSGGVVLGAVVIGVSVALLAGFGLYRVDGVSTAVPWVRYLTGFLAVALLEELIFRVFLFRLIEKSLGSVIAIVVSTALFGFAHLLNPNATWISTASLAVSSLILVAAFLLTRRLWLCVGLHWSWNLSQALCSLPVSGSETTGLLRGHLDGAAWLTGGAFGVEASLPTLLVSTITASALLAVAYRKGHFMMPYWKIRRAATPGVAAI